MVIIQDIQDIYIVYEVKNVMQFAIHLPGEFLLKKTSSGSLF